MEGAANRATIMINVEVNIRVACIGHFCDKGGVCRPCLEEKQQ